MENKAMTKQGSSWPALFDTGWMDKFFNAPIDGFFNLGKVMNVPAVNVSETTKDFKLVMAVPGMEKKDFKLDCDDDLLTISA
ncbi:MAG: Hsp20/alpha crystallin family protein [Chitinophagaceae bacterium]|nr:Hsp20/alpha crystallin family protein [Chitinophagaceae bacterium]